MWMTLAHLGCVALRHGCTNEPFLVLHYPKTDNIYGENNQCPVVQVLNIAVPRKCSYAPDHVYACLQNGFTQRLSCICEMSFSSLFLTEVGIARRNALCLASRPLELPIVVES